MGKNELTPVEKRIYEILEYVSNNPISSEEQLAFDARKISNELRGYYDAERKNTHT